MTEKQFLKNFRKHCEIARDLGIFSKGNMLFSLRQKRCPFTIGNLFEKFHEKETKRNKLFDHPGYWSTADEYVYHFNRQLSTIEEMLSILKSIPWRKK